MSTVQHLTTEELDAGLDDLRASPGDRGTVEMIVCRPAEGERRVIDEGELVVGEGLVGDNYLARGSKGGPAHPEAQLNLMNSRSVDLVAAGDRERWPLAGDQFFVDFDLSAANAPAGTRLAIGTAVIEVSLKPHTGCAKFSERFGVDAARWVNAVKDDRRRGINAMVVRAGVVKPGDTIAKLD
jgi:MOSC domain-containing protein YiiM